MGIKRIVDTDFWNDEKVIEQFTPEDKLFFLYLMTNPHTSQLGIYPITVKHMSFELGYSQESVIALLDRFENKYGVIKYSSTTREVAIKNYLKHSIIKGGKPVEDCLTKEIKAVKDKSLLNFVYGGICDYESLNDTVKSVLMLLNENDNDNDNDNENENDVSYHDTYHDTSKSNSKVQKELMFTEFWNAYPKKKNKANAIKSFNKMCKNEATFEAMMKALEVQKRSEQWQSSKGKYIPYPTTWLNGELWNDEMEVVNDSKPSSGLDFSMFIVGGKKHD